MTINETLDDREKTYGDFNQLAACVQSLKSVFRSSPSYTRMTATQREAMEMGIMKMCRIWYGDPMHFDSWRDLAGYATLAVEEFNPRDGSPAKMEPAPLPTTPLQLVPVIGEAAE